jgi:hypothetical protein
MPLGFGLGSRRAHLAPWVRELSDTGITRVALAAAVPIVRCIPRGFHARSRQSCSIPRQLSLLRPRHFDSHAARDALRGHPKCGCHGSHLIGRRDNAPGGRAFTPLSDPAFKEQFDHPPSWRPDYKHSATHTPQVGSLASRFRCANCTLGWPTKSLLGRPIGSLDLTCRAQGRTHKLAR